MLASSVPGSVIVVGVGAFLVVIVLFVLIARMGRRVNLTPPGDGKPEWMREAPPAETIAATKADGEDMQVFDYDAGEAVASPFAEQIEDIVQARLAADPELAKYKIDLGTRPDGQLEVSVNGVKYDGINAIPDEKLKQVFREAIAKWEKP